MNFLTRRKADTQEIVNAVLEALPVEQRAHRMIDLDQPLRLDPKPLIQIRDSAIKHALKNLIHGRRFSICGFRDLCKLARVYPPNGLLEILEPLHCHEWVDMEPEFRNQIQQHIIACFIPVEPEANAAEQEDGNDD